MKKCLFFLPVAIVALISFSRGSVGSYEGINSFKESKIFKVDTLLHPPQIDIQDVKKHIGDTVSVFAHIYGFRDLGDMVLVNLGAAYPNQLLTAVLKGEAMTKAKTQYLTKEYLSPDKDPDVVKALAVNGKLILIEGKPAIIISDDRYVNSVVFATIREPWGLNH